MLPTPLRWILCALIAVCVAGEPPRVMHILSVVQAGGEVVITIDAFDPEGDEILPAQITTLPGNVGEVYHPSQIFSTHGLDPTRGEKIDQPGTFLRAADKQQLVYARPSVDSLPKNGGMWGQMAFSVSDSSSESGSSEGLVYFVPPGGGLVGSDFSEGSDGWQVCQDGALRCNEAMHSPTSRGLLNQFISGEDTIVHTIDELGDGVRWYFVAPDRFTGNWGIAYKGLLELTLGGFSGDFGSETALNAALHLVEFHCSRCNGHKGRLLAFPFDPLVHSSFSTGPIRVSIDLHEGAGWTKDPKDSLQNWLPPTKCEMIEVLSNISQIRVLGDLTRWHESVGLDSFLIRQSNQVSQLPLCAQVTPNASVCTC